MIDREKRDFLIKKFRELLSGSITNLEYDDLEFEGKFESDYDPAIWLIWDESWRLYDDFREHKVELTKEGREFFARCLLFLYSDLEYEWPLPSSRWTRLQKVLVVLTFGLAALFFKDLKYEEFGDYEVWPFIRKTDFEEAKKKNIFFYQELTEKTKPSTEQKQPTAK